MINVIELDDFSGRFFLSENEYNSQQLQDIINEYTKEMLVDLIGILLYNDFYQDFQTGLGTPTQERWQKFLNGEIYQPVNGIVGYNIEYQGVKPHLIRLIYAKLMRDPAFVSDVGFVDGNTDGAKMLNLLRTKNKADKAWNEGISKREACVRYLYTNSDVYEDWELYYVKYTTKGTVKTETLR